MSGRIPARSARLAAAILATAGALAITAGTASAAVIYDNIPKPLPGNLPSVPFEAASTSEFGGQVAFAGTDRTDPKVIVTMSSWACGNLQGGAACKTAMGATFPWPITLNVYEVGPENAPGAKLATDTQTFNIPFRPSANKSCAETPEGKGWGKNCFRGKAHRISFDLEGVKLPEKAILSIAYDTSDYGYAPTHEASVGEDSLNVAVAETPSVTPSVGTDPLPEDGYVNSSWPFMYGGLGTLGTFSIAGPAGYLEGYQPAFEVKAKAK